MSSLEGNLNVTSLGAVLEVLTSKNPAATWLVSDGRDEKVIYFSTGGIRLYSTNGRRISRVEDYLLKRGLVSKDQLAQAAEAAKSGRKEGMDEVLDRLGIVPRARYQEATSDLIYLELCDLVTWENAIYEFYEGNPPPEIFDQEHPALFAALDVKALAGRVREWCQEWMQLKAKLYSERLRPKLAVPAAQVCENKQVPAARRHLCRLIDGQRTLRELARFSGAGFQETARMVRDALREGHLRATLVSEKEVSAPAEVLEEIERLEEALDKAINTILIHKRIAGGYEKIGDKERASEHYQSIGDLHAEAGRLAKAMESYQQAITLAPQNIGAHESLIRRLQDAGQEDRALEEIVGLAKKLVSFGLLERAVESLSGIMGKVAHLFDVRLFFAEVLTTLGRVPEAVAEYLKVAREKQRVGILDGVEDIYRRILALDPLNREARAGLVEERKRQAGKVVLWIHRSSTIAAAVLLLAWFSSEVSARVAWAGARTEVKRSISLGEFQEGFRRLRELGMRYPGNLLSGSLLTVEKELFREAFDRTESDLDRAARLRKEGKLSDAQEVFQTVVKSNLLEGQLARARHGIREVDSFKKECMDLCRSAELCLNARLYDDAFSIARKVLERYPEEGQSLQFPFYIRSEPPGAEVKVNGTRWGVTPLWILFPLGSLQEIQVLRPGFASQTLEGFAERRSPYITVVLKRETSGR